MPLPCANVHQKATALSIARDRILWRCVRALWDLLTLVWQNDKIILLFISAATLISYLFISYMSRFWDLKNTLSEEILVLFYIPDIDKHKTDHVC